MNIEFGSSRLEKASTCIADANWFYGPAIGRKIIQRILILRAVESFSQLHDFRALKLHPLKGDRTGQYAIALTANYRLILEKLDEETVMVMDVEDYHGN